MLAKLAREHTMLAVASSKQRMVHRRSLVFLRRSPCANPFSSPASPNQGLIQLLTRCTFLAPPSSKRLNSHFNKTKKKKKRRRLEIYIKYVHSNVPSESLIRWKRLSVQGAKSDGYAIVVRLFFSSSHKSTHVVVGWGRRAYRSAHRRVSRSRSICPYMVHLLFDVNSYSL